MSAVKIVAAWGLAAIALAGCGASGKPLAGTRGASGRPAGRGAVDDPRTMHLSCMKQHHLHAVEVGLTEIQVGSPPNGPVIHFAPTPGAAQQLQISNQVAGAEVIGSAVLFPDRTSDEELKLVEDCLAEGVAG